MFGLFIFLLGGKKQQVLLNWRQKVPGVSANVTWEVYNMVLHGLEHINSAPRTQQTIIHFSSGPVTYVDARWFFQVSLFHTFMELWNRN